MRQTKATLSRDTPQISFATFDYRLALSLSTTTTRSFTTIRAARIAYKAVKALLLAEAATLDM